MMLHEIMVTQYTDGPLHALVAHSILSSGGSVISCCYEKFLFRSGSVDLYFVGFFFSVLVVMAL
jgi:hypothetical protein